MSFYYCHDLNGTFSYIAAEVTKTSWGERHTYVPAATGERAEAVTAKEFHVSPFLAMEGNYHWRFSAPGDRLFVQIGLENGFEAILAPRRQPLDRAGLALLLVRHPAATLHTLERIYANTTGLGAKGAPRFAHPQRLPSAPC